MWWAELTRKEKTLITILTLINLLNYVDRQVIFPLFHSIQVEFGITDFQLGLIGTVFVLVFAITTVPLGMLADRYSRRLTMFFGVLFWSIATLASGLATGFKSLLTIRGLVGMGEASYAPAATAMIADNFDEEKRARVQGLFHIGMFVGGTIGAVIGAAIVVFTGSWRLAFLIVAIPGLALAFSVLRLKDDLGEHHHKEASLKPLLKNLPFMLVVVAGTGAAFTTNALVAWGVEYLRRFADFNVFDASLYAGVIVIGASIGGILIGSAMADRWQKKNPSGRSLLVAVSKLIGVPLFILGFMLHGNFVASACVMTVAIFLSTFYFGPAAAVIQDMVPSKMRASAFALYILIIHTIGGATAPAVIGKLSDMYNLNIALQISMIGELISGLVFLLVAYIIFNKNKLAAQKVQTTKTA